ncbi:MAG: aldo/keto reductase [Parcubacteria group bacterium Gr01-1014_31]|nr:MAG: aldo/keto reductase [Parcubacteria group bacterium Gr01-1014_31]
MEYDIPLKQGKLLALPALGFGTYQMGGQLQRNPGNDDARDIAGIRAALAAGLRHVDTAEAYAEGHCEELVAEAIADMPRDQIFLASKVYPNHLRPDDVHAACRGSLRRLGVDYLDLYLIHGPNPNVPLAETMGALDELVQQGLIRFIGVSNFDVPLLQEANRHSRSGVATNQIHYSLVARAYEDNGTLEYCRAQGVLVTAYRPIGKYGELSRGGQRLLDDLAARYGKTPAQVAVNWVISKRNVVALVKTSNPAHLAEDLGALGWQLSEEDAATLDNDFPRGTTTNVPGVT